MADFPPAHPGDTLREDFFEPLGLSRAELARALGIGATRLGEVLQGRRSVTPDLALRLARYFGTSPEFWLGLQSTFDLETARDRHGAEIEARVRPRAA